MIPLVNIQAPSPSLLFGPAITGQDTVLPQNLPTTITPPVNVIENLENDLRNNPFIDRRFSAIPTTTNPSVPVDPVPRIIPPPSAFYLTQLIAQSAAFGAQVRSQSAVSLPQIKSPEIRYAAEKNVQEAKVLLTPQSSSQQASFDIPLQSFSFAQDFISKAVSVANDNLRSSKAFQKTLEVFSSLSDDSFEEIPIDGGVTLLV